MNSTLHHLQNLKQGQSIEIYGCNSPTSLAVFLGVFEKPGPHIICTEESLFTTFEQTFLFFNSYLKVHKCSSLDFLFIDKKVSSDRMGFLYAAQKATPNDIFLVSKKTLLQKTIPLELFKTHTLTLKKGDFLPQEKKWIELGYQPSFQVEEVGFFTQKGWVLDIFSPSYSLPIRLETKGDQIESIRFFDPFHHKSIKEVPEVDVIPPHEVLFRSPLRASAIQQIKQKKLEAGFLNKLSKGIFFPEIIQFLPCFYSKETSILDFFTSSFYFWDISSSKEEKNIQNDPYSLFLDQIPEVKTKICFHSLAHESKNLWPLKTLSSIKKHPLLDLKKKHLFISVSSPTQEAQIKLKLEKVGFEVEHIKEEDKNWNLLKEEQIKNKKKVHLFSSFLPHHFESEDSYYIRGDQLLSKTNNPVQKNISPSSKARSFSFSDIDVGDLIVDKIHGVCIYKGLKKMQFGEAQSEYVELEFKDKDKMYVPVSELNRLFKIKTHLLKKSLDKLGSSQWTQQVSKAKKSIQSLVIELLRIYQLRSKMKRPHFSPPGESLIEFGNQFPYEETAGQLKAIEDVFQDMQKPYPMDRLIIGDSGYGKTEVCMRAAFKVVEDGYQVAVLTPTTVLSLQHFNNFKDRFSKSPIEIGLLNRMVSSSNTKSVLQKVAEQKIDILIGSHRLLSSDVHFRNLGLVVIDEEHRFGVKQKEKLKKMKLNVDCIYMSATPIPRTLNMSLSGAKDISVIQTPPKNRLAPRSFIIPFEKNKIISAISREIQRGGQVLFIHNKIQTLQSIHQKISKWFPDIEIRMTHGRMKESELESHIVDFFNHKADLLLSTTIVETGMDFARANTIIINDAQNLGLSQLYQLRGRVGRRAHAQSYCYFVIPEHLDQSSPAVDRLNFLQTHNEMSSGYQVARYDLEIRGGGEFLGSQQSGHIQNIGYDFFLEMLEEGLNSDEMTYKIEPEIRLPFEAYIPEKYIPQEKVRLMYYKYLSTLEDIKAIPELELELKDGFGSLPEPVKNLIGQVMIRHRCYNLKIKELALYKKKLILTFFDSKTRSFEKKEIKLEESSSSWIHIYEALEEEFSSVD